MPGKCPVLDSFLESQKPRLLCRVTALNQTTVRPFPLLLSELFHQNKPFNLADLASGFAVATPTSLTPQSGRKAFPGGA